MGTDMSAVALYVTGGEACSGYYHPIRFASDKGGRPYYTSSFGCSITWHSRYQDGRKEWVVYDYDSYALYRIESEALLPPKEGWSETDGFRQCLQNDKPPKFRIRYEG